MRRRSFYNKVNFSDVKKLMAYIFMPLIFAVLGYLLIYLITFQYVEYATDMIGMIMSKNINDFSVGDGNISIYDPDSSKDYPTFDPSSVTPSPTPGPDGSTPEPTPAPTPEISRNEITLPKTGEHYAQIICEDIGLDAKLFWGDGREELWLGIGQYTGSKWPGYGRTILVSGHNNTYFECLEDIEVGDIVTIRTNWGLYQYRVYETKVAKYNDKSTYDLLEEKETLVMYTCYPFGMLYTDKSDRYFVYAEKVIGPTWR